MHFLKMRRLMQLLLFSGDLAIVPAVYYFSFYLRSKTSLFFFKEVMPFDRIHWVTHYIWLLVLLHCGFMYFHGLYDRFVNDSRNQVFTRSFQAVSIEMLVLVAVYFFRQDLMFPRSIFLLVWILNITLTISWRLIWLQIYRGRLPVRNLVIVGANDAAAGLLREIERLPAYGIHVSGILTQGNEPLSNGEFMGYPVLGHRDDLLNVVRDHNIHEVVIATEGSWQEKLIDQISRIDQISARICIIPTCYEILIAKINHLRLYDIPLIELIKHPRIPAGKRAGDFVAAMVLFIVTLPLFLITILAIYFTSGRPVFFQQIRIGRDRKPFTIFKFRTLVRDAENDTGPRLTGENDEKITAIGRILRKYRIDELPQLINILKGEMSFVGPRPERPYFVDQYIDAVPGYGERFKAPPGITGLAQVNGGYATTPENKLKYDIAYIYNQSLWLDMRLMLETVKVILTGQVNP